jgi:hypothetical protein
MERGLLWLPLLGVFVWLAWAGWNEYQKVQAYETWAVDFDRSKYDVQAVLGQAGNTISWGQPTRQGPINLISLSLADIDGLSLASKNRVLSTDADPPVGQPVDLVLTLITGEQYRIPFTDGALADQWKKALHQSLEALKSAST